VVYPTALRRGVRAWMLDGDGGPSRDVIFIGDLIDTLSARYNIDPARVYANGLSNGGGMSFALSCTMRHRIAAVGLVASAQTEPWQWCMDTSAVPMIAIHGTDDKFTRYHGGTSWIGPVVFPSIPGWVRKWADRNRCGPTPADSRVAPDVTLREYTGCRAPVAFYTIEGGGHTWPGGSDMPEWFLGRTSRSIDASAVMWDFFTRSAAPASDPRATPARPARSPR
jgi:polyhydroxybutyrate depolymerase